MCVACQLLFAGGMPNLNTLWNDVSAHAERKSKL